MPPSDRLTGEDPHLWGCQVCGVVKMARERPEHCPVCDTKEWDEDSAIGEMPVPLFLRRGEWFDDE